MTSSCVDHGRKGFGLGYATARITRNGVQSTTTLHRKVHYEQTGEWPEVVRHTCDNARCIEPTHLIGGTQVENVADCRLRNRTGDHRNFGAANGRAVLTESDCEYIRIAYVKGSRTTGLPALARTFGCSTSQIYRVVTGNQRSVA